MSYKREDIVSNYYEEDDENALGIHELDVHTLYPQHPNDLKNGSKYHIIGKPGTGKSTLLKSIIYYKKHIFPVGQSFSGTEDSTGFFSEIMPSTFTFDGINVDDLTPIENFKRRQNYAKKYLEPKGQVAWAFNIMDDLSSDTRFFKTPIMKEVYKNGRHWREMHLWSTQYCMDTGPEIRSCTDGVFMLREPSPIMREKLYKNYGSCVESLSDWNDILDQLTDDYNAVFINMRSTKNTIEDCLNYYKANPEDIPHGWKFGCKEYWDFHYDRTNQVIGSN